MKTIVILSGVRLRETRSLAVEESLPTKSMHVATEQKYVGTRLG